VMDTTTYKMFITEHLEFEKERGDIDQEEFDRLDEFYRTRIVNTYGHSTVKDIVPITAFGTGVKGHTRGMGHKKDENPCCKRIEKKKRPRGGISRALAGRSKIRSGVKLKPGGSFRDCMKRKDC